MPVEAEPLVTLTVNTVLGPPLLFACLVEEALQLAELLQTRLGKPLPHKDALRRSASSRLWFFLTPDKKRGLPVDLAQGTGRRAAYGFLGVGF